MVRIRGHSSGLGARMRLVRPQGHDSGDVRGATPPPPLRTVEIVSGSLGARFGRVSMAGVSVVPFFYIMATRVSFLLIMTPTYHLGKKKTQKVTGN